MVGGRVLVAGPEAERLAPAGRAQGVDQRAIGGGRHHPQGVAPAEHVEVDVQRGLFATRIDRPTQRERIDPPSSLGKTVVESVRFAAGGAVVLAVARLEDAVSSRAYAIYRDGEPRRFPLGERSELAPDAVYVGPDDRYVLVQTSTGLLAYRLDPMGPVRLDAPRFAALASPTLA